MFIDVQCPKCREAIPVTESAGERKIDCPACGEHFSIPAAVKPPSNSKSERGQKSSTRRARRDDDDDDRPSRRDDGGGGMVGLLLVGGVGLLLMAVGFGVAGYLIFSGKEVPKAAENKPGDVQPGNNAVPPANNPPPKMGMPGLPAKPPGDDDIAPRPSTKNPNKKPNPPRNPDPVPPPVKPDPPNAPPPAPIAPSVMLPAPAEQIAIGAGGKFLFLHLKANRQVAVFDPVEKKIVKYIPVSDDDVLLAAGNDHLLLGYPKLKRIDRVLLATFEQDKAMDVPSKWPLRGLALGAASSGPLLAATGDFPFGDELFLIDILKMRRYDNTAIPNPGVHPDVAMKMWAAHDGRAFTATSGGLSKPNAYVLRTNGWIVNPSPCNPPFLGADGETVFGGGSIASISGQPIGEKRGERGKGVWYLPASQGPFFLSLNERTLGQWPHEKKWPELQVHIGRDPRPMVSLPELPELMDFVDFFFAQTKPLDQHIFFLPFANTLAILPVARDRIYLRTIDVKAELAKTPINYLAVVSRPPSVKAGEEFKYKPEIWSKQGGVKLKLEASPAGMKLEGETLTWTVPAKFKGGPSNVILTVSDASGKEQYHSFDVAVFPAK